jgi:hypothetical protein
MIHRAKVAWWVNALFGGVALVLLTWGTLVLVGVLATNSLAETLFIGLLQTGCAVLFALALLGCHKMRYEVTSADLIIRSGPFRTRVPLDAIVKVIPTNNPLSAPAPSLDRLEISYRRKDGATVFTLIAPQDKEGFVRDLASVAPHLRRAGDDPLRLTTS